MMKNISNKNMSLYSTNLTKILLFFNERIVAPFKKVEAKRNNAIIAKSQ